MSGLVSGRGASIAFGLLASFACSGSGAGAADSGSAGTNGELTAGTSSGSGSGASGSGSGASGGASSNTAGHSGSGASAEPGAAPSIAGCAILPRDHLFNTPIAALPIHGSSAEFMKAVGVHRIHLDLGSSVAQKSQEYYGIPYNVVHSKAISWVNATFTAKDSDLSWDPTQEADCAVGPTHTFVSPCTAAAAAQPQFPLPELPLVEGGIDTDPSQPPADHHILLLDADRCTLWELYHAYPDPGGGWDIFGAAFFDLGSNQLRPAGWTSADAAGFPILPLLLRADEASRGEILHALRFTIPTGQIREEYTWPARHLTRNKNSSSALPPMGQAFRIKSSYAIPASFNTQARAILQALKTYGMYLADGGSSLFIQGEPSASWQSDTFDQVQSVSSDQFEAVDLSGIEQRAGFDVNSAKVP